MAALATDDGAVVLTEVGVAYASATGTARELAYKAAEALRRAGVRHIAADEPRSLDWRFDEGAALLQRRGVVVIVCSTTGDGEVPANMRKCWRALLRKDAPRYDGLRYALYGLGDARYGEKFNAAARRLDARLKQLGGVEVVPRVLADACAPLGGVLSPFGQWTRDLAASLALDDPDAALHAPAPDPRFTLAALDTAEAEELDEALAGYRDRALLSAQDGDDDVILADATVASVERLTSSSWWQDVRHIAVDGPFQYNVGDVAVVLGRNDARTVERCVALLKRSGRPVADVYETAARGSLRAPRVAFPRVARLGDLLTFCVDLSAPPSQDALARLSPFCADPEQRDKLVELATPGGARLYDDYVRSERRSLVDVLEDFSSCTPPFDLLVDELETLKPRLFSIASAPSDDALALCVAKVDFATPFKRKIQGLCSTYLCGLREGDRLRIGLTRAAISTALRARPETLGGDSKLILVGAGTGIAPMRSLIRARSAANVTLVFGCRDPAADFLYGAEWASKTNIEAPSFEVLVAVSRHPSAAEKAYVTRRLRERAGPLLEALLHEGASLFIAGNAQMATDVRNELLRQLERQGLSPKAAKTALSRLEKDNRLAVEAYG